jgi:hypothetical protein
MNPKARSVARGAVAAARLGTSARRIGIVRWLRRGRGGGRKGGRGYVAFWWNDAFEEEIEFGESLRKKVLRPKTILEAERSNGV